jgi:hypothetical protein
MNHEVIPVHNAKENLGGEVEHNSFLTSALYGEEVSASRSYPSTPYKLPFSPSKPQNNNTKRAEIYWLLKFRQGRKITSARLSFDSVLKTEKCREKEIAALLCPFRFYSI